MYIIKNIVHEIRNNVKYNENAEAFHNCLFFHSYNEGIYIVSQVIAYMGMTAEFFN